MKQQNPSSQENHRTDIEISTLLKEFSEGVNELLRRIPKSFSGRVIMGYRTSDISYNIDRIQGLISLWNGLIENYIKLFPSKLPSKETVKALHILAADSDIASKLRHEYIRDRQIHIPNVKAEKMVELYDFPRDVDDLIAFITSNANTLRKGNFLRDSYHSKVTMQYFRSDTGFFEFNDDQKKKINDQYTVFATDEQLVSIISLNLVCEGLSNLHESGYSLENMPEIDHRLMRMIRLIKPEHGGPTKGIEVYIDRINNPRALDPSASSYAEVDVHQRLTGAGALIKILKPGK